MLVFYSSFLHFLYGLGNEWMSELLKERGLLGVFFIQKFQGPKKWMVRVQKGGWFELWFHSKGSFSLLQQKASLSSHFIWACMTRPHQDNYWPQRKEQRQNKQAKVETRQVLCKCRTTWTRISVISAQSWSFEMLYAGISLENVFSGFLHFVHS